MMGKALVRALLGSALLTACGGGGSVYGPHDGSIQSVSDTTPGDTTVTTPFLAPVDGANLAPLFPPRSPIETLQFTLPDGTLITRFGNRAVGQHARERGEEWNEAGFGPNETVDAQGHPVDKGRGAYLGFVPNSFRNRTWGMEIVDDSRVAGVTRPTLKINTYNPTVDFLPGGTAFFRAFDRVGVTGYGWMDNGELLDAADPVCQPVGYPADGQPGADHCTVLIRAYPGHAGLGSDGFPDGTRVDARPLKVGDPIEMAPS